MPRRFPICCRTAIIFKKWHLWALSPKWDKILNLAQANKILEKIENLRGKRVQFKPEEEISSE